MRKIEIPTQQRNGVSAEKLGAYNRMGITGSRNRVLKKKLGFYDNILALLSKSGLPHLLHPRGASNDPSDATRRG